MRIISKIMLGTVVLALGACGGGSSTSGGITKIKGTWQPTTYLSTISCPGDSLADSTGGNIVWTMGVNSDLIQTEAGSPCVINADVTGYTATALAGQTCLVMDGGGDSINITLTAYTFSLSADYQTATEAGSGSAQVTFFSGGSATCTYSLQATYHKIGT